MFTAAGPRTVAGMTTTRDYDANLDVTYAGPGGPDLDPPRRSLAAWCADRRWRTLAAAVAVLVGAILLLGTGLHSSSDTDQLVGNSRQAEKIVEKADFGDKPTENVVVSARRGALPPAQVRQLEAELRRRYTGLTGVAEIGKPALSPDRGTLLVPVVLAAAKGDDAQIDAAVRPMLAATARVAAAHPALQIGQVGPGSIDVQAGEQSDKDFHRAELSSLPVTLAILLIAFGSVIAAGVPVLLAIAAVITALGATALISHGLPVDSNTQSLVLLIGLAVGVDYALFVVRRSREERAKGLSSRAAVVRAGATAGRAVIISGITVVVSMAGMLVAGGMFTSMAIGATLVVAVAVLFSATVLPAALSVLGDRVEKLRLPFTRRRARRNGGQVRLDGWWGRLAGRVSRRPLIWSVAAGGLLVFLAIPAFGMKTSLFGAESLPESLPVVAAYHRLGAAFPQQGETVDVVVTAPAANRADVRRVLTRSFPAAKATGRIAGTAADLDTSTDGTVTVLHLASPYEQSDHRTDLAVDAVRDDVVPAIRSSLAAASVTGAGVDVGGAADTTDLTRWLDARLPLVVGFVLVLTFVVMLVSFGSIWLASATVLLNLLSVGAGYGVMTAVFQNHWAEGILDFTSLGAIAAWLPLLMFVILFGLSMDYHVFVVSRVREAWKTGVGPREAVRIGVAGSAGTVTSAAAVMVAVFAIFATLSSLEMKQLGIGLATAVLMDATLVRGILLPAVLALLGDRAHTGPKWVPSLHD
jgi:RND superfamily putative drug exporter